MWLNVHHKISTHEFWTLILIPSCLIYLVKNSFKQKMRFNYSALLPSYLRIYCFYFHFLASRNNFSYTNWESKWERKSPWYENYPQMLFLWVSIPNLKFGNIAYFHLCCHGKNSFQHSLEKYSIKERKELWEDFFFVAYFFPFVPKPTPLNHSRRCEKLHIYICRESD